MCLEHACAETFALHTCVYCSCTLDRGSLLGKFTPSLARSFFSSSLSTSSRKECWGIRCACEPDGQNSFHLKLLYLQLSRRRHRQIVKFSFSQSWTGHHTYFKFQHNYETLLTLSPRLDNSRSFTVREWLGGCKGFWFVVR